ncbi:MAG TPA: ThuA domain-containing protein [Chthonomonadaceae bacterium]|nr:ThuA domain-containing protein [Chthonomonadaceae bacterium]
MLFRYIVTGAIAACAAGAVGAALLLPSRPAHARAAARKHVLVVTVTKGFRHGSIPVAEKTIESLGASTGKWDTDFVRTDADMAEKMTAAALKKYDAVIFANTTGVLPLPDPQGFLDYINAGHGFAAMHSGSDTFHQWPGSSSPVTPYVDMLGGEFQEHHNQCAIDAHIADPANPALAPLTKKSAMVTADAVEARDARKDGSATDGKVWKVFDEIYIQKNNDPSRVHTLLWLDKWPNDGSPNANKPELHLISWTKSYGKGRVFYTELGHRDEVWNDPLYQAHITGGIEFALGLAKGSTTPGNVTSISGQ